MSPCPPYYFHRQAPGYVIGTVVVGNITLASLSINGVLQALVNAIPKEHGAAFTDLVDCLVTSAVTLTGASMITTTNTDAARLGVANYLSVYLGYYVDISRIGVTTMTTRPPPTPATGAGGAGRRALLQHRARIPSTNATSTLAITGARADGCIRSNTQRQPINGSVDGCCEWLLVPDAFAEDILLYVPPTQ